MSYCCSQIVLLPKDVGNLEIPTFYLFKMQQPFKLVFQLWCTMQKPDNMSALSAEYPPKGKETLSVVHVLPCFSAPSDITGTHSGCYCNLLAGNFRLKTRDGRRSTIGGRYPT